MRLPQPPPVLAVRSGRIVATLLLDGNVAVPPPPSPWSTPDPPLTWLLGRCSALSREGSGSFPVIPSLSTLTCVCCIFWTFIF